jgi:hypothetical protein
MLRTLITRRWRPLSAPHKRKGSIACVSVAELGGGVKMDAMAPRALGLGSRPRRLRTPVISGPA